MSNVNTKAAGQPSKAPKPASTSNTASHAPSVPISLYREVANELQITRTTVQSLKTQNQELTQKNQQLRVEIERVVQSALHLRQVADPTWAGQGLFASGATPSPDAIAQPEMVVSDRAAMPVPSAEPPEKRYTEQDAKPHAVASAEPTAEISTWWLIMIICLIVITAFGTGFLIVRPLLPSR
ncbi:hypothetical protein OsccyDRAFT_2483 [Leptolyngbyaceae cyanobacterium JSC-12]|nr:hypothetical protein OsccyDRAFT_2483 [Leptolyngbyaceae cyanobacterium JSC-12]